MKIVNFATKLCFTYSVFNSIRFAQIWIRKCFYWLMLHALPIGKHQTLLSRLVQTRSGRKRYQIRKVDILSRVCVKCIRDICRDSQSEINTYHSLDKRCVCVLCCNLCYGLTHYSHCRTGLRERLYWP